MFMVSNGSRSFGGVIDEQVRIIYTLILYADGKQKNETQVKVKVVSVTEVPGTKAFRGA